MQSNPNPNDSENAQYPEANPSYQRYGQNVPPAYQPYGQNERPSYQYPAQNARGAVTRRRIKRQNIVGKIIDFIRWFILALEIFLLLRFALKLIGADPFNPFAQFLYNVTGFFLYPFIGIVPNTKYGTNVVHIFEWSTLIGMAVYGIIFWLLRLFLYTTVSSPQEPIP